MGKPKKAVYPPADVQIAELTGMNRVTTTKELNRFAEKGWIRLGYREILVEDERALRRCGNQKNLPEER